MNEKKIQLTILIPAYNEEKTIIVILTKIYKALERLASEVEYEVVVINDNSDDGTRDLLNSHSHLYDKVITHKENKGKGAAVISGLGVATKEYILIQDADLEYDPENYVDLIYPILHFKAELVMGSRFLAPKWTRVSYYWHKLGNKLITSVFNIMFNTTFTDIYSGYILFKRALLNEHKLERHGWDQQAEILSIISKKARIVYEVPINYAGRTYEDGKKIRAFDVVPVLRTIVFGRFKNN